MNELNKILDADDADRFVDARNTIPTFIDEFQGENPIRVCIENSAWRCALLLATNYEDTLEGIYQEDVAEIFKVTEDFPTDLWNLLPIREVLKKTVVDRVEVTYGMTLNLGNYESFRVDATVAIKNKDGKATSDEMFDEAWELSSSQLKGQVLKVRQKQKGTN